jgi:hypothetical protein
MRLDEIRWLVSTAAAQHPGCRWIELGCWRGRSWSAVALSLPRNSTIVAVDTFDGAGSADEGLRAALAEALPPA